ncbi:uncharacterized protein P884DRAFT_230295 [Thermothelomyces heterothallicus CBS 202.75]|uniref:uncharacterized protein n=1 Tax=Thermothelomyces heterothallicus CBS 202.75 TaxID=1149848 RepID=UPI003743549E
MGIKGIYKEIGPGDRISLCKLAIDTLEQTGRPLRLAIDFSIWQFQVQASRGGANPAIRTLFYRLTRLLGLAIRPIFVFDGPNKPAFKRNKRSSGRGDSVSIAMAKRLIRLFGFTIHEAPGEAEAECAMLQQKGIVDAVLSEDVDTIMFGCRKTLRNWSAEGSKGSKTPTHVSMFDADAIAAGPTKLDREGMVLVALMSGGDYLPEGVPGCGVKVACEAARAGFGRDLCRIKRADRDGLAAWKARLLHELRTNESGFFRTRHKALDIPENFPNMEILRYYTHPVVSREAAVERVKREFLATGNVDIVGLREFTRQTFDWEFKIGAIKLIRVLAPSLLVQKLLERYELVEQHPDDLELKQKEESALVKAISNKRAHFSTDAIPELRISFVPADIVNLDLANEPEEVVEAFGRSGIALNSDDEFDEDAAQEFTGGQSKLGGRKPFDPLQPELAWIPVSLAKLGIPLTVEDWEGKQRTKEQRVAAKLTKKQKSNKTDMPVGALDKYVKVIKNLGNDTTNDAPKPELASSPPRINSQRNPPAPTGRSKQYKKTSSSSQAEPAADLNPWTLASLHASPRAAKCLPSATSQPQPKPSSTRETILISSSPAAAASPAVSRSSVSDPPPTPTRAKRVSPLVETIPSPTSVFHASPGRREHRLSDSGEPVEEEQSPGSPQLPRRARPFKRVKSGAGDTTRPALAQKSIKGFGRVLKNQRPSQEKPKRDISDAQLIEIVSEDDNASLPPYKRSLASESSDCNPTPPGGGGFNISNDDDPFAALPPPCRVASACSRAVSIATPDASSKSKRGQEENDAIDGTDTGEVSTGRAATVVPPADKSAKTKILIPRTSLDGEGYFTTLEVDREDADSIMAAHNECVLQGKAPRRRAWRQSEVSILDLTGED